MADVHMHNCDLLNSQCAHTCSLCTTCVVTSLATWFGSKTCLISLTDAQSLLQIMYVKHDCIRQELVCSFLSLQIGIAK